MDKIAPLGAAAAQAVQSNVLPRRAAEGAEGFGATLKNALENVSADQQRADRLQRQYQLGDPSVSIEETMLASQSTSISFQALVQVRNRLVSAYHDIMNMPV